MKKSITFLLFTIMMLITSEALIAQPQVSFKMKRPPLNQLKAADLWSATIINSGEVFTAYLYGSMTNNENGELIATGQTVTFEVKRGTTNFKVSDLPSVPDINYLSKDPKYKQSFMNTGGAPPGDYRICVQMRFTDNTVAGEDCFDQKIMGGDAPQLISPRNDEELNNDNPIFTWMHFKAGSDQTYTLKIVELKGNESPENAMVKNKAFFEKEGITMQMLQYPSSAAKFEAEKRYAWLVLFGDIRSEVRTFRLGPVGPWFPPPSLLFCSYSIAITNQLGNSITEICKGETATLAVINSNPAIASVMWSYADNTGSGFGAYQPLGTGNPRNTNSINNVSCTTNPFVIRRYRATITFTKSCIDFMSMPPNIQHFEKDLKVWCPAQAGNITASPNQLCAPPYTQIQLILGGPIIGNLAWTTSNGTLNSATISNPRVTFTSAGTHTVKCVITNGTCAPIERKINIKVENPISCSIQDLIDPAQVIYVCPFEYRTLKVTINNPTGNGQAQWRWEYSINGCAGPWTPAGTNNPQQNTNQIGPTAPYPANITSLCWRAIVTSVNAICPPCTSSNVTYKIIQKACKPNITMLPAANPKCPGSAVTLTASTPTCGTPPFTYKWYYNGMPYAGPGWNTQTITNVVNPGNYNVVVSNKNNCDTTGSNIFTLKDCILDVVINAPCCSDKVNPMQLSAFINNTCGTITSYLWTGSGLSCTNCPTPTIPAGASGTYTLKVTTSMGCTKTVSVNILKCP